MGNFYSCRCRLPLPNDDEREQLNKLDIEIDDFGYDISCRLDISGYYIVCGWGKIKVIIVNGRYQIFNKLNDTKIELK